MISTRQWARLDPDNAVPWLHLAGEATAQADESGLAEAVFHIAHARRSESYSGVVTHEALAALPLEQQGVQALPLLSAELTWSLPPMQTTARYCNDDATRDANRRLVCGDVADTLLQRGSTLIERRIGRRIAQRAGWPAAMLAALDEETDALMYALRQQLVPDAEAGDCANKLAIGRYVRLLAEHGEVGAAREAMRRGGRSIAELAAAYRAERLARREKEAAAAAASAAATPP